MRSLMNQSSRRARATDWRADWGAMQLKPCPQNGVSMITTSRRAAAWLERVPDVALLLARLTLGLLFIDHGLQKFHAEGAFEGFLRSLHNVPAPALTGHVMPAVE